MQIVKKLALVIVASACVVGLAGCEKKPEDKMKDAAKDAIDQNAKDAKKAVDGK